MRGTILSSLAFLFLCLTQTAALSGDASLSPTPADAWHARALEAAESGDLAARDAALDAAVAADPDHAPSRGERGEVWADERWVSAEYAQHLAKTHTDRNVYHQRRASMDNSPAAHARMARWCERAGLTEEARPHWLAVLAADPESAAALGGIDAVWREGRLVPREQAAEDAERAEKVELTARDWEKRFQKFERKPYFDEEALSRIERDLDAAALGPVERRIALLMGAPSAERPATEGIVRAFLDRAAELPGEEVTAFLCRVAVFAGAAPREAAIGALKERPRDESIPLLLSCLAAPVTTRHEIVSDKLGNVTYTHRFEQTDDKQARVHESSHVTRVGAIVDNPTAPGFATFTTGRSIFEAMIAAQMQGVRSLLDYHQRAEATDAQVAAFNQAVERSNDRVVEVLGEVSGRSLGDEPTDWWDYWRRETGYDDYVRPTERTYDFAARQRYITADPTFVRLPPPPPRRYSCFVAGTPVWARDGKQAIETLKAGDLVLSRDPHRGGLVWRVVIETTVREPSPMVTVVAGNETIQATEGHPFWVVGHGWRMAKELAEGDVLSTIEGPAKVTAIEDHASERAYNLVVEGAANYYVGERGVLVHDNTPRVPAAGLLARR